MVAYGDQHATTHTRTSSRLLQRVSPSFEPCVHRSPPGTLSTQPAAGRQQTRARGYKCGGRDNNAACTHLQELLPMQLVGDAQRIFKFLSPTQQLVASGSTQPHSHCHTHSHDNVAHTSGVSANRSSPSTDAAMKAPWYLWQHASQECRRSTT